MKPVAPVKKNWPRWAVGPLGNRALFQCAGDVMPGWKLEIPLPGTEPVGPLTTFVEGVPFGDYMGVKISGTETAAPPKNKGGRPRRVA